MRHVPVYTESMGVTCGYHIVLYMHGYKGVTHGYAISLYTCMTYYVLIYWLYRIPIYPISVFIPRISVWYIAHG